MLHGDGARLKNDFTQKMTLYCLTHGYGHGLNWNILRVFHRGGDRFKTYLTQKMTLYCLPRGHRYGQGDGDRFKTYFTQIMDNDMDYLLAFHFKGNERLD